MTLAKLTSRMEEKEKLVGKIDGRRFNCRSRAKMAREMRTIEAASTRKERRKFSKVGLLRGLYTNEEIEESKRLAKELKSVGAKSPEEAVKK